MTYLGTVNVMLKKSILDPQGSAVGRALLSMGYTGIADVRIGKRMEIRFEAEDPDSADRIMKEICSKLLANPVMEQWEYEIEECTP